jgi:hypothetical protein
VQRQRRKASYLFLPHPDICNNTQQLKRGRKTAIYFPVQRGKKRHD